MESNSIAIKVVNYNEKICLKVLKLDYKKIYKKLFKIVCIVMALYVVFEMASSITHATLIDMVGEPKDFTTELGENYKWLGSSYRNNYYLDIKEPGFTDVFDKATNAISNWIWIAAVSITYILILVFHVAFSMDLANMFSSVINGVITQIKTTVFDSYISLVVAVGMIYVLVSFWKRNTVQVFTRLGYMALAIALATIMTLYSADIVSLITQMSKSIGASSIVSIQYESGKSTQTDVKIIDVSGELWYNTVHRPWLKLEGFPDDKTEEAEKLLAMPKGKTRQTEVDSINSKDKTLLPESAGEDRIVPALFTILINIFKVGILLILCLISVLFQLMTILLVFFGPIILLLSIIPSTGGVSLLAGWGKQLLGAQLGIIFCSFVIAMLLKIDSLVMSTFGNNSAGWYFAAILQVSIYGILIWQRERVFDILKQIQRSFGNGGIVQTTEDLGKKARENFNSWFGNDEEDESGKERKKGKRNREATTLPEDVDSATKSIEDGINGAKTFSIPENENDFNSGNRTGDTFKPIDLSEIDSGTSAVKGEKPFDTNFIDPKTIEPNEFKPVDINKGFDQGGNNTSGNRQEFNPGGDSTSGNRQELNPNGANRVGNTIATTSIDPIVNLIPKDNTAPTFSPEGAVLTPIRTGNSATTTKQPEFNPGGESLEIDRPKGVTIDDMPTMSSGSGSVKAIDNPKFEGTGAKEIKEGDSININMVAPPSAVRERTGDVVTNNITNQTKTENNINNITQDTKNIKNVQNDINNVTEGVRTIENIHNDINNSAKQTTNVENVTNRTRNIDRTKNINNDVKSFNNDIKNTNKVDGTANERRLEDILTRGIDLNKKDK